jgi:hypothetical protein
VPIKKTAKKSVAAKLRQKVTEKLQIAASSRFYKPFFREFKTKKNGFYVGILKIGGLIRLLRFVSETNDA